MNILSSAFLRVCLLAMLLLPVGYASAASADSDPDPQSAQTDAPVKINVDAELIKLQKQLDNIKQQVSGTNNDSKFGALNDTTQELVNNANELANAVAPQRAQIQAQTDVIEEYSERLEATAEHIAAREANVEKVLRGEERAKRPGRSRTRFV